LCYLNAEKAVEDFSAARATPHSANRALRIDPTATRVVASPTRLAGMDKTEFTVTSEGKTWALQASNQGDMERWMHALTSWMEHERSAVAVMASANPQYEESMTV
jgi:hypothetical protein